MTQLTNLYLNQYALGYVAEFILAVIMLVYLARHRGQTLFARDSVSLLVLIACHAMVWFLATTAVWQRQFYFSVWQPAILFTINHFFIRFVYLHPPLPKEQFVQRVQKEYRLVSWLTRGIILAGVIWALYQTTQLRLNGRPATSFYLLEVCMVVVSVWALVISIRRLVAAYQQYIPQQSWRQHWRLTERYKIRILYVLLIIPLVAVVVSVSIPLSRLMEGTVITLDALIIPSYSFIFVIFWLISTFLNYNMESTSLLIRIVGVTLVIIFALLSLSGLLLEPFYRSYVQQQPNSVAPQTVAFTPLSATTYQLTSQPMQLDPVWGEKQTAVNLTLPFNFPFYQVVADSVTIPQAGIITFEPWSSPRYAYNYQAAITARSYETPSVVDTYLKMDEEQALITWQDPNNLTDVTQVMLAADGQIHLTYQDLSPADLKRIGIQAGRGSTDFSLFHLDGRYNQTTITGDGIFTDYEILYQQAIHSLMLPLAYLIIGATLFVIVGIPFLLRAVLVRPLNNLVQGVKAVETGDLQVQLPIHIHDEIGTVTQAFNKMVTAIYEADQYLEAQVAARTQALAESEQRFRGLAQSAYETIIIHEQGTILDINQAVTDLLGYTPEELSGQSLYQFLSLDSQSLQEAEATFAEIDGLAKDGQLIPLEIRASQVPYQQTTAQVIVMRDLRERKEIESQRQRMGALEERERIGRELHDDFGQMVGYVHVQTQAALKRLQQDEVEPVVQILADLEQVSQETHNRVRQYILGIRTGADTKAVDFWTALQNYVQQYQVRYGLTVSLTVAPDLKEAIQLSPVVETQLLRIIQEGLTNIYKHAQASQVDLIFLRDGDALQLLLRDNGRGFNQMPAGDEGHFGLKIMRERAEKVNGRFQITSTPEQGTQIQVHVPRLLMSQTTTTAAYPWRVLLVDDHALFSEGLANMLRLYGVDIIGLAPNGRMAETLIPQLQPDLILMDVHMPEQDGIETTKRIKANYPDIKIVMLTMSADETSLFKALKYGASGYLLKNLPAPQFLTLLTDVMSGKSVLSPNLATQVLTSLAQQQADRPTAETAVAPTAKELLTERQLQVLECLSQGMSNKQIAQQLHISQNTVKYHIGQIMERLHLQNRHQLIRYQLDQA